MNCFSGDVQFQTSGNLLSTGYLGYRKPAQDTLKMLVVFVRDSNDQINFNSWPAGADPIDYEKFISTNPHSIDTTEIRNISGFFKVSSNSKFIVYGQAKSYTTTRPYSSFTSAYSYAAVELTQDIVTNRIFVDSTLDLSTYDNWTNNGENNNLKEADSTIDFILFIYKGTQNHFLGAVHDKTMERNLVTRR